MIDLRDIIITIVGLIVGVGVIVLFSSCRQVKVLTVTEYRDSVRTEYRTDSVVVYARDSVYIRERGDTVLVDKYHILYRDRLLRDTLYIGTEVEKPVVTEVEIPTRYIPKWVWWLLACNVALAVYGAVRLYMKIKPI